MVAAKLPASRTVCRTFFVAAARSSGAMNYAAAGAVRRLRRWRFGRQKCSAPAPAMSARAPRPDRSPWPTATATGSGCAAHTILNLLIHRSKRHNRQCLQGSNARWSFSTGSPILPRFGAPGVGKCRQAPLGSRPIQIQLRSSRTVAGSFGVVTKFATLATRPTCDLTSDVSRAARPETAPAL
jgi:hypothetical protein